MLDFIYRTVAGTTAVVLAAANFFVNAAQTKETDQNQQKLLEITSNLKKVHYIAAKAYFSVLLPSASDPVEYTLVLNAVQNQADTLYPYKYVIDWQLPRPTGVSEGFCAYFDGNHYRQRDNKLQEYHMPNDSASFKLGIHRKAQFANLLPFEIAQQLNNIATDSAFTYDFVEKNGKYIVEGVNRVKGYDAFKFRYIFEKSTYLPLQINIDYNPASISEQNLTVKFNYEPVEPTLSEISEESLVNRYPDRFGRLRTNDFAIESLRGKLLPDLNELTITHERYRRVAGAAFRVPTVVAFIEANVENTSTFVSELRKGIEQLPFEADVVFVFVNDDSDLVEQTVGNQNNPGEYILFKAKDAARNCGVANLPALLFCDTKGSVRDIAIGQNQNLASVVIQKTTQIR